MKKLEGDFAAAEKEHETTMAELREEETELVKTVAALENALKVLAKHLRRGYKKITSLVPT